MHQTDCYVPPYFLDKLHLDRVLFYRTTYGTPSPFITQRSCVITGVFTRAQVFSEQSLELLI